MKGFSLLISPLGFYLMILQPVALVANEQVDVQVLHEVGRPDEHLVAHDQDGVPRVLHVLPNLGALKIQLKNFCVKIKVMGSMK